MNRSHESHGKKNPRASNGHAPLPHPHEDAAHVRESARSHEEVEPREAVHPAPHGEGPRERAIPRKRGRTPQKAAPATPKSASRRRPRGRGEREKQHTGRMVLVFGSALLLVCALGVAGLVFFKHRSVSHAAKDQATEIDKGPPIQVARVRAAKAERDVTFTGDVRALFQTTLYAKVSGYVRDIRVDKGDFVKKDQILGTIESPETDQALVAAQSDYTLRKSLAARAKRLAPDIVSRQDLDTSNANMDVSRANLSRAVATQEYEQIRAPFDGVVTARYVDPGALMPAATGATQSALPFVDVADPTTLRIDVYAGQDVASFVQDGDAATIWQDVRPDQRIAATVTRRAGALDPRSRTMLIEVQLDNRHYGLVPGTFANVTLHIHAAPTPSIPAEALVSRGGKNMVARVENDHVHFVEVEVGRSDGQTIQIERGIAEGDVVALNVPTEVNEGSAVQPSEKTESPKKPESKEPREGSTGGADGRSDVDGG